ncbi:hypothetical protein QBC39DRAFT_356086 [Podospora conica]|nr:hypothetical protein QBC39DRAFT_356086 [Schizothecium conicum]
MGRRRKSSTSTLASVDQPPSSWNKELAILKPYKPGSPDPVWPQFTLNDVVIYEKDGTTIGNPLLVDKVGPMVIRGRLEVDDDDEENVLNALVNPKVRSAYIEITGSDKYSIGYDPSTLWVAGATGWFEIRPAPQYEAMYLEILQAMVLFFEVQNIYMPYQEALNGLKGAKKRALKKPAPPTLDEVFFGYAVGVGDGVTRDEAEARYIKWTHFLLSHFTKDEEVLWEGTPFAKWVKEQDAKKPKIQAETPTPQPIPAPPSTIRNHNAGSSRASNRRSIQDVEMMDLASPPHDLVIRKGKEKAIETPIPVPSHYQHALQSATQPKPSPPSRPKSKTPQPPTTQPATPQSDSISDSSPPIDHLLDVMNEIASTRDIVRKGLKAKTVQTQVYLKCKVPKYEASPEVLAYYSKDLLSRLGPEWKGTEFFGWLRGVSSKPLKFEAISASQMPLAVRRRAKAAPKASKGDVIPSDDGSQPDRARKSGKNAGLRPPQKRPFGEMDLDDEAGGSRPSRAGKYVKYYQPLNIGEDYEDDEMEETSPVDDILEEVTEDNHGSSVPLPKNAVPVIVRAERIPDMSPAGPNGTWRCDQDGCGYVVRAADDQAGQERIMQHFLEHEHQKEKVDLALKESAAGHVPINHLLEKIQAQGQKKLERAAATAAGEQEPIPAPIKRRLLA